MSLLPSGETPGLSLVQQEVPLGSSAATAEDAALPLPVDTIVAALAYSDLFDFPLTLDELVRYQIGTSLSRILIKETVNSELVGGSVSRVGDYYCLPGRESTIQMRLQREQASHKVWNRACIYARLMSRLPFVRMVAVTGALAVNNISTRPDIDLLIVAEPDRVWICRRFLIVLVRLARAFGDDVCPNYIIASTNLDLEQRDFFTAHELAQMVPLYGVRAYRNMLQANRWAGSYLPSGFAPPVPQPGPVRPGAARKIAEAVLRSALFNGWERREMERLRSKLRPTVGNDTEVICSPVQCKGHTSLHRQSITARYANRLRELGLYSKFSSLLDEPGQQ